jgi:hypothetical protein
MARLADIDPENFTLWRDREGQTRTPDGEPDYGDVIVEPAPSPVTQSAADLYAELAED